MLHEAMRSYYAPLLILLFFGVMVLVDKLFSQKIKRLFLLEIFLLLLLMAVTSLDQYFAALGDAGMAWRLRSITTCLNFVIGPCSPMIMVLIYDTGVSGKMSKMFYLPQVINAVLSVLSLWNGWIFSVNCNNLYKRGPLFPTSLTVGFFYLLTLIVFSAKQQNKPNRRAETTFLTAAFVGIGSTVCLELFFDLNFMIWNVSSVCVVLYYLLLTTQKILYDSMTGTYSRVAYEKQMEKLNFKHQCTIAMIDLNNLKQLNDRYGHFTGDLAICRVTEAVLKQKSRHMKLYRYGGDEFVLISSRICEEEMKFVLKAAQKYCGRISELPISFSYGVAIHEKGDDIYKAIYRADETMYRNKAKIGNEKLWE
ncbi:GGDEF domain-containing protein [Lacrimispora sp. AGF001]|uniref:GGDEF domain-containing protein n=1 Tax=Lacrimispora sp. AGF001 TaxID=3401631 RepID=UPI003B42C71E